MESRDLEFEHIGDPTSTSNKLHKSMNVDSNLRAILESILENVIGDRCCNAWSYNNVMKMLEQLFPYNSIPTNND
jgi:hypothetical protein